MNFVSNLLKTGWSGIFADGITEDDTTWGWLIKTFNAVEIALYVIMAIVGVAGAIYAIWLGINLARADEQGKRDDAKKHLITVLIAVGVTAALVLFFNLILPLIVSAIMGDAGKIGASAGGIINALTNIKF